MTALSIMDLHVDLGGRPALAGVSLSVAPGERVGLLGPNGAGKTTLLRAVLGLVRARSGRVETDRAAIGYVPQRHEFAWDFPVTVAGAVRSALARELGRWRRPRARHREAIAEALERTGLADLAARPVGELSGGQRQRVLVARALARRPSVLLLDEPYTGVDVPTQELLTALLAGLSAEGTALLATTHDLPQATAFCDRIVLLNKTIVAEGPPSSLADPALWLRAFGVSDSGALTALGGTP